MASPFTLQVDSPVAKRLQDAVQGEVARRGWTEGEDDAVMSEYILVMLANRKVPHQVAAELRDLLGEDQQSGIDEFVNWLWDQAARTLGQVDSSGPTVTRADTTAETRRRSASPMERTARSDGHDQRHDEGARRSDRWNDQDRSLLLHRPRKGVADHVEAMPDRGIRIAGRGRVNANGEPFQRNKMQTHQDTRAAASDSAGLSIFARAGVPNPRADAFVPRVKSQSPPPLSPSTFAANNDNLLSRLDPMLPNNAPLDSEGHKSNDALPSAFPEQPLDAALCRYGLKCTSPTCIYSHASPSAVPKARQTGQEPLVLRQEPCFYQKDCTKPECDFSHISPAVKFVLAKADRATAAAFGSIVQSVADPNTSSAQADTKSAQFHANTVPSSVPCRYGKACYRTNCHFAHPADRVAHVSERLRAFGDGEGEGEMEIIIPTAN